MTYSNSNESLENLRANAEQLYAQLSQRENFLPDDLHTLKKFAEQLAQVIVQCMLEDCDSVDKLRTFSQQLEQLTSQDEAKVIELRQFQDWHKSNIELFARGCCGTDTDRVPLRGSGGGNTDHDK